MRIPIVALVALYALLVQGKLTRMTTHQHIPNWRLQDSLQIPTSAILRQFEEHSPIRRMDMHPPQ